MVAVARKVNRLIDITLTDRDMADLLRANGADEEAKSEVDRTIDSLKALVAETGKALGTDIKVKGFVRLALGEGVEKPPAEDFAAEVAAAMAGQA